MIIIYCPKSVYGVFYLQIAALKYELSCIFGYEIQHTDDFESINKKDIIICFGYQIIASKLKIQNTLSSYNIIVYNTEQLHTKNWNYLIYYMKDVLEIWDYSKKNIKILLEHGIYNVRYVPFGYSTAYELINDMDDSDRYNNKSITFVETMNDRRLLYLKKLSKKYQVNVNYGNCYFENYSNLLKRNGIFINIHYYSPAILDIIRIVPLICNKCCIISERSDDNVLDTIFENYVNMIDLDSDYDDKLSHIMENAEDIANTNYNKFKEFKYSDILNKSGCIRRLYDLEDISNKIREAKINMSYGAYDKYIDVSQRCLIYFLHNDIIHIPKDISFNKYFGDPLMDVEKTLIIHVDSDTYMYNENREEDINILI